MARPRMCRRVSTLPGCVLFKPAGIPMTDLPTITLTVDELEALRLADLEQLYQQQAAIRMGVSRQTFGRIVTAARNKVARVLVEGLALKIEGGAVELPTVRQFQCTNCQHAWSLPFGTGRPIGCPACDSGNWQRIDQACRGCCDAMIDAAAVTD